MIRRPDAVRKLPHRALPALLCAVLLVLGHPVNADDLLTEAKQLIDQRQAPAAYEMLKPFEEARSGEPDFDYLLGLAALDSGMPLEAVFALERVIDVMPDHGPARAELARAYLGLGETEDARKEFEKVRAMDLPREVTQRIDQYLSGIDLYEDATRTRYRPYVLTGFGYDSNVNSATDNSRVAVPALGGLEFLLGGSSREFDSAVWNVGAGMAFTSPLDAAKGLSLYGSVDLDHRMTFEDSDFTGNSYGGQIGFAKKHGQHQLRIGAEGSRYNIDGAGATNADRKVAGGIAQYQYTLSQNDQLTLFGQFSMIRFPDQRVRNVNRATGGLGWAHAFSALPGQPVMLLSVFGGNENALNQGRGGHFGRDFIGARGGLSWRMRDADTLFTNVTFQGSDYDRPDPTFLETREDDYYDFLAGYIYRHDKHWSLTPTVRYNMADSNLVTSDFDRVEVMMTLRNDF